MHETPDSGTDSTTRCSDTTEESIQSTLGATTRKSGNNASQTRSKRHVSGMNASNGQFAEPPPRILVNELSQWTYLHGETRYPADDTGHLAEWSSFVSQWANIKGNVDWEDLEERARFLNKLYVWCEQNNQPFPLEKFNGSLNFSSDKPASEAH